MSEAQWLNVIVSAIKEKDHDAAVALRKKEHRAEVLLARAPIFWRTFGDFLKKFIEEMKTEFGDDVTAGELSFRIDPAQSVIHIDKTAFPFVTFSAAPKFDGQPNAVTYSVFNPEKPCDQGNVTPPSMPSRFEVVGEDVELHLNGRSHKDAEGAARFIIEKLFTV